MNDMHKRSFSFEASLPYLPQTGQGRLRMCHQEIVVPAMSQLERNTAVSATNTAEANTFKPPSDVLGTRTPFEESPEEHPSLVAYDYNTMFICMPTCPCMQPQLRRRSAIFPQTRRQEA